MQGKNRIVLTVVLTMIITTALTSFIFATVVTPWMYMPQTINNTKSTAPDNALLNEVAAHLDDFYFSDVTPEELIYGAAKGMAAAVGDPYTRYYTPDEFNDYINNTTGRYVGVGLVLSANDKNELVVVAPYENSPGADAGILPGDIIVAVDGEMVSGTELDKTAKHLRGEHLDHPEGEPVVVTIRRDSGDPFDVTLIRKEIDKITVRTKMLNNSVGYLRISEFDSDTDQEFDEGMTQLNEQGAQKLVLDLRDNPGGDFNVCCRLASNFIEKGEIITYTQNKQGVRKDYTSTGQTIDMPLVILINGGSASASEVLCGALRDHNRTRAIIGTTSYGKGITQSVFELRNGGGMSITVDKYYTPNGESIHGVGIAPDTVVELPEDLNKLSSQLTYEEDLQLQKAIAILAQ